MHSSLLLVFYLTVIFAPLGFAFVQAKPPRSFQDELASGFALVAFATVLSFNAYG